MYIFNKIISTVSYIANHLGYFYNRVVECCKCGAKGKAKELTKNLSIKPNSELTDRQVSLEQPSKLTAQNPNDGTTIKIKGHTPKEVIQDYICYFNNSSNKHIKRIIFGMGHIDSEGRVINLHREIYDRLKAIGLIWQNSDPQYNSKIFVPILELPDSADNGFTLIDHLGWFGKDDKIQKKIKKIAEVANIMALLAKTAHQRISKFSFKTKVSLTHINSIKAGHPIAKIQGNTPSINVISEHLHSFY